MKHSSAPALTVQTQSDAPAVATPPQPPSQLSPFNRALLFSNGWEHPFWIVTLSLCYRPLHSGAQLTTRPEPIELVKSSLLTSNYMAGYLLR